MDMLTPLKNLRLPEPDRITAEAALAIYEALRPVLPTPAAGANKKASRLIDLLDEFDALILDGFGVINVGLEKIPDIEILLKEARTKKVDVIVLTNGASHPSSKTAQKYQNWDLPITAEDVISSRDALSAHITAMENTIGWVALDKSVTPLDGLSGLTSIAAPSLAGAKGFAMLGSSQWTSDEQHIFETSLQQQMRPVLIGNPDVTAPNPNGFTAEPGYWATMAMQHASIQPVWFGKPHPLAFALAYQKLCARAGRKLDKRRIAMIGDSLHTDILGGGAFGIRTVLVTSYGLLRDHQADQVIAKTGIAPDWQVPRL